METFPAVRPAIPMVATVGIAGVPKSDGGHKNFKDEIGRQPNGFSVKFNR